MGVSLMFALLVSLIGVAPLLLYRQGPATVVTFILGVLANWWIFYASAPSTVWPFFGLMGFMVFVLWIISALIISAQELDTYGYSWLFAVCFLFLFCGRSIGGAGCARATDYAAMIGEVEERVWTQDVQPKDPKHIRMVSRENALFMAGQRLGEAGTIGSQFQLDRSLSTIQRIQGELWWVIPLDFTGYFVWSSTRQAPGYIMVHAEDTSRPVVVKSDESFVYTPGAWFDKELQRHLWSHGYMDKGLTDFSLEIDEAGKAWWVVTVFEPTIFNSALKVLGVVIVDPMTGDNHFEKLGEVAEWVDRVVPEDFVQRYLTWSGEYSGGWLNSWTDKLNLTEPERSTIIYGADGQPYFVTGITSNNNGDESLTSLVYTNVRTGKSVRYKASGPTETAALKSVNNVVNYQKQHGTDPLLYNMYGEMVYVVPLLGESHTWQGLALVRLKDSKVVHSNNPREAFAEFQKSLRATGQELVPDLSNVIAKSKGIVWRTAHEDVKGETTYYIMVEGVPHLFLGGADLSPKLRMTEVGDEIEFAYEASGEDIEPLIYFDNLTIKLEKTKAQTEVAQQVEQHQEQDIQSAKLRSDQGEVQNMTPAEVQELIRLRDEQRRQSPAVTPEPNPAQ